MYNYRPRQCSADEAWPKPRFNRTKLKRIMRVIKRIQPVPSPDCCSLDELRGFQCSGRSFECREQSLGFSFPLSLSRLPLALLPLFLSAASNSARIPPFFSLFLPSLSLSFSRRPVILRFHVGTHSLRRFQRLVTERLR